MEICISIRTPVLRSFPTQDPTSTSTYNRSNLVQNLPSPIGFPPHPLHIACRQTSFALVF
ncbi:hypothetical protein TorRG33x02_235640 [Trema orientale]|uniref:Uncharacterized protein n=1 Tax=Trema orientale TaxID=63057 RepID=A0A2P5E1Z0_TREOI|nr:hypothetical protein TorRG33x02_235640 [Trema orientale]